MPTKIEEFLGYRYDTEELKKLNGYVKQAGENSIFSIVLEEVNYDDIKFKQFLNTMVEGEPWFSGDLSFQSRTDEERDIYFKELEILYNLPVRDLPVLMGTHREFMPLIKWRLQLGR